MNPKENDNEIIELSDEELDEIFTDDDFDNGEEDGEIRSFHFSNPDPYAKVKPRPDDAPKREFSFDEKGNIVVKNPSAQKKSLLDHHDYKLNNQFLQFDNLP